jgi:hypothetical protein
VALDQQPVVLVAALVRSGAQADQGEFAVQPLAGQDEPDFAVAHPVHWVAQRLPGAAVPDLRGSRAILPLRDGALEIRIADRMILDMHRDAPVMRVERRAFPHRPAPEHAAMFQPDVPMQAGTVGPVLLYHEDRGVARRIAVVRRGLRHDGKKSRFAR